VGGYRLAGGATTRWGAVVRADNLCRLTSTGQADLVAYGVRTIIDLRTRAELAAAPHPFSGALELAEAPTYLHLPLYDDGHDLSEAEIDLIDSMSSMYCLILKRCQRQIGAVVRAVAEAREGGVLVHCWLGKDRTGVIIALLLALAGADDDTIVQDYALSDSHLSLAYERILASIPADTPERQRVIGQLTSHPETMRVTLEYLSSDYGGAEGYLREAGVEPAHIAAVAERLRG
jgi:protein-tyrosine phosphatase